MKNRIKFGKNEDAVSPVIGVILMVAITVILAAVIAAFVFGMGTPVQTPQASLIITEAKVITGDITIQHRGGDPVKLSDVRLVVYNTTSFKSTFDPLIATTDATTLSAGSNLILHLNSTILGEIPGESGNLSIDTTPLTLTTPAMASGAKHYYYVGKSNDAVTIEMWFKPNGQQIAKIQAATTS